MKHPSNVYASQGESSADYVDILFLIRSMDRGGAQRQLSLLARTLHARGLNVAVAVFYGGGALEGELLGAGVEVLDLEKGGRWSNLGVIRRLQGFVQRRRPRVLHSYMATQNVLALVFRPWLKRHGCSVVCGIRTALPNAWNYSKVAGVLDAVQSALLPQADRVISNSARALEGVGARVPSGRAFVIPNGVECERFMWSAQWRASQRAAWGVDEVTPLLGLVGRLDPRKCHSLLVDAVHQAGSGMSNARLVFVGDGSVSYREKVQAHAENLGLASRILWVGPSDDLSAVYSALDILCLCSVTEGFPNVVAEAMCTGLPCVATDVGDVAELIGDCGWVVPSGDAYALAQALLEACDALPAWDRERPRRRMVEQFSVDKLADRTLTALAPHLGGAAR